ncbi:MAG: hypothetical protein ACI9BO_000474 [Zhongshania sp.]|jgi:hypothetical protein
MSLKSSCYALSLCGLLLFSGLMSSSIHADLNLKQKTALDLGPLAKLDNSLLSLYRSVDEPVQANAIAIEPYLKRALSSPAGTGLIVELVIDPKLAELERLSEWGVSLQYLSLSGGHASVRLAAPSVLASLAELPWVSQIRSPEPRVLRVGRVTSRAGRAMRADVFSTSKNVDGSGQGIGIISDSFAQTYAMRDINTTPAIKQAGNLQGSLSQNSGDLPGIVTILRDNVDDGTDEGAAMAELAYDVAPGVDILFHAAGNNRREMADAISTLCSNDQVTVVVDDILFLGESVYQDDLPAQAATACVASGVPYLTAAGNDGDRAYRKTFSDIGIIDEAGVSRFPTGNDLHNWSSSGSDGFLAVNVAANSKVYAVLSWNQPHGSVSSGNGAQIDLDLYATLTDNVSALNPVSRQFYASSANTQGTTGAPTGDAFEFVTLKTGANLQTFYLAVDHFDGSQGDIPQQAGVPLEFRLLFIGSVTAEYPFNGPSVWGHSMASNIASVAAVPWWESPEFAPQRYDTARIDPEPFSSRGGSQTLQFDSNGNYKTESRIAPQFAAPDGNNNTILGSPSSSAAPEDGEPDIYRNFFGTSAAAPNAAAVFTLLKQAQPAASPAQLIRAVQASATDVNGSRSASGFDDVSGSGLINAEYAAAVLESIVSNEPIPSATPTPDPTPTPAPAASQGGGGGGGSLGILAILAGLLFIRYQKQTPAAPT